MGFVTEIAAVSQQHLKEGGGVARCSRFNLGLLVGVLLLTSCAAPKKKTATQTPTQRKFEKIKFERRIAELQKELQALRVENEILVVAADSKNRNSTGDLKEMESQLVSPQRMTANQENESVLYRKILQIYESGDEQGLKNLVGIHLKAFPKGTYVDDSIFWMASHLMARQKYHDALSLLNRILNEFPESNRTSSALLAKGIIFKKLSLQAQAREIFEKIRKQFPESQDAKDAEGQLKTVAAATKEN